jgi:hypothetical protein
MHAMNVKELARRAWSWLVGSSCRLTVDSCQNREPTTDNRQLTTALAPLCPICKGRPVRGIVEPGFLVQWFHTPCTCTCGCGAVRRSVCCPVCAGAGRVTRELIVEYEGLGEVALGDYRRAARGN